MCEDKFGGGPRVAAVFCFNRLTGEQLWISSLGLGIMNPKIALKGNQIIAERSSSENSGLFQTTISINATTGEKMWQSANPEHAKGGPMLLDKYIVSVGYRDEKYMPYYLCFQDYGDGHVIPSSAFYAMKYFITKDEFVYTDTAKVYYYSLKDNSLKWAVDLQSKRIQSFYNNLITLRRSSPPIAGSKYIYMSEEALAQNPYEEKMASLLVLDKESGKLLRELNFMNDASGIQNFFIIGPEGKSYSSMKRTD